MKNKVCIHCHFYQPPRENPWLEAVEMQDSAYPFHDWNERITDECYRPNSVSRILDGTGKIVDITNNYAKVSFNFGPTLLNWLRKNSPEVYQRIIEADRRSQELFGGHGSAIAQAYNHMIMPLANDRDKWTQVVWAIEDFRRHFNRLPEGMWMPETAIDLPTLQTLADNGIKFTILAPRQAARVRKMTEDKWHEVDSDTLDTRRAYMCRLPSGAEISLFFYHGSIARRVAYGNLVLNGDILVDEIFKSFDAEPERPQLVHIATDGETYGHHYRRADMALAYCLHRIDSEDKAQLTVYGQYLEETPADYEVQIHENTSWSCEHGIERWKDNCGCATDPQLKDKQQWRAPLRISLDWLRDRLRAVYEEQAAALTEHPWTMRDRYYHVISDRSQENIDAFFGEFINGSLSDETRIRLLKLLEMQRNAMLMYTSCGWFFNDISGLETTQILCYAARAVQLAYELTGSDLEPEFLSRLEQAPSNSKDYFNGRMVYEKLVKPSIVDLPRVAAHLAVSKLFGEYSDSENVIYAFSARTTDYHEHDMGLQKLAVGRTSIRSNVLTIIDQTAHCVLYFGGQNLTCFVSDSITDDKFNEAGAKITDAFKTGDTAEVVRLMNVYFDQTSYSLWHLFRDALYKILHKLLHNIWAEMDGSFRRIYETHYTIMKLMRSMRMSLPKPLGASAEFVLSRDLSKALDDDPVDIGQLETLADQIEDLSIQIEEPSMRLLYSRRLDQLAQQLNDAPENLELLQTVTKAIRILLRAVPRLGLQETQNYLFDIMNRIYEPMLERAEAGDEQAGQWITAFNQTADLIKIAVPQLQRQT